MHKIKCLIPTKAAAEEMMDLNLHISDIGYILKNGLDLGKRGKGVVEKGVIKGKKIIKVVCVEMDNYIKVIHVGEISYTKKFKRIFSR